eukprot:Nk52_evm6s228 gene=Nk52_evmTU6s228
MDVREMCGRGGGSGRRKLNEDMSLSALVVLMRAQSKKYDGIDLGIPIMEEREDASSGDPDVILRGLRRTTFLQKSKAISRAYSMRSVAAASSLYEPFRSVPSRTDGMSAAWNQSSSDVEEAGVTAQAPERMIERWGVQRTTAGPRAPPSWELPKNPLSLTDPPVPPQDQIQLREHAEHMDAVEWIAENAVMVFSNGFIRNNGSVVGRHLGDVLHAYGSSWVTPVNRQREDEVEFGGFMSRRRINEDRYEIERESVAHESPQIAQLTSMLIRFIAKREAKEVASQWSQEINCLPCEKKELLYKEISRAGHLSGKLVGQQLRDRSLRCLQLANCFYLTDAQLLGQLRNAFEQERESEPISWESRLLDGEESQYLSASNNHNPAIVEVNMSFCYSLDGSAELIKAICKYFPNLTIFYCAECFGGLKGSYALRCLARFASSLEVLDLSCRWLYFDDIEFLSQKNVFPELRILILRRCVLLERSCIESLRQQKPNLEVRCE